jgi:hypothetical protein
MFDAQPGLGSASISVVLDALTCPIVEDSFQWWTYRCDPGLVRVASAAAAD